MDISVPMIWKGLHRLDEMSFSRIDGGYQRPALLRQLLWLRLFYDSIRIYSWYCPGSQWIKQNCKTGCCMVLTTPNNLSSWAEHRTAKGRQGHSLFQNIFFRSPGEMCSFRQRKVLLAGQSIYKKMARLSWSLKLRKRVTVNTWRRKLFSLYNGRNFRWEERGMTLSSWVIHTEWPIIEQIKHLDHYLHRTVIAVTRRCDTWVLNMIYLSE